MIVCAHCGKDPNTEHCGSPERKRITFCHICGRQTMWKQESFKVDTGEPLGYDRCNNPTCRNFGNTVSAKGLGLAWQSNQEP